MPITFYDFKMAPSPRRARIILAEKDVPHDAVQIDMMTNEQMGDAYRKINPNCTIPALQLEDGTVLTDNAGIAICLEETYPEHPLMGTTPLEKADIATWQSKIEGGFGMAVAHTLRNMNPAMKNRALPGPHNYAQIPELSERGFTQIDNFMKALESHLDGRDFIAADQFSIADITAACTLDFARVVNKKADPERHPNIVRWRAALAKRPSFSL